MINIDAVRQDTPSCTTVLHFNNAGASLMPSPVYDAVVDHLALENSIGGYEAENRVRQELEDFYSEFATLLNASPAEIAYVENATRAWDMAFYGLPLHEGDRILTHGSEYVSNYLALLQQAQRRKLHIDLVPSDEHGQIDVQAMAAMITDRTRLVAITHVPTQGGLINPVVEVGKLAKEHGLIYLLDACQSAGQIELDVKTIQCDVLSGTGRKFLRGPRGTGFLFVREGFVQQIDPPFVDLHSTSWTGENSFEIAATARRFENWETFVAGRVGLMTAVRYANRIGLNHIESRVSQLASNLRAELSEVPGVAVHDLGLKKSGLVTFTRDKIDASAITSQMLSKGINISTSPMSSARLDLGKRGLSSLARASVHYFNTDNEIDRFVEAVRSLD